jgi:hypothetical protein
MSKPYNPNTQGWPFAILICAITAGLFGAAYSYHKQTYRHPRDPMMQQVYANKAAHGEGEEHAEGGEHADEEHAGEAKGGEASSDH